MERKGNKLTCRHYYSSKKKKEKLLKETSGNKRHSLFLFAYDYD